MENANDTSACRYCQYAVGDEFFRPLGISFDDRWTDAWILFAFFGTPSTPPPQSLFLFSGSLIKLSLQFVTLFLSSSLQDTSTSPSINTYRTSRFKAGPTRKQGRWYQTLLCINARLHGVDSCIIDNLVCNYRCRMIPLPEREQ